MRAFGAFRHARRLNEFFCRENLLAHSHTYHTATPTPRVSHNPHPTYYLLLRI